MCPLHRNLRVVSAKIQCRLLCLHQFIPSEAFQCFFDEFVAQCIRIHHSMAIKEELSISHLFIVHSVNAVGISYSTKFQRSPLASLNAFSSRARAKFLSLAGQNDVSLPAFKADAPAQTPGALCIGELKSRQ